MTMDLDHAQSRADDFSFSGLIVSGEPLSAQPSRRVQLVVASLLLHAMIIAGLVVAPPLRNVAMPDPANTVNAFFVVPAAPASPAPPPAAAAGRAVAVQRVKTDDPHRLTAPVEIPDTIEAMNDFAPGMDGGVVGGVEGGVAGGIVGGIVGGTLDAAPLAEPRRVGGDVREPRKLVSVKPVYPKVARQVRVQGGVVIDCLIDARGHVVDARVVEGDPLLNEAALAAVRQWRYTPTLLGGVPIPVKMTVTVQFHIA